MANGGFVPVRICGAVPLGIGRRQGRDRPLQSPPGDCGQRCGPERSCPHHCTRPVKATGIGQAAAAS